MDDVESKEVELTEAGISKTSNGAFQLDRTPCFDHDKTKDEISQEGFPKFRELPAELRIRIWKDAVPTCGTYPALIHGREDVMPQQPPQPALVTFRRVFRLEPVPRDQQEAKLRMRLDTIRAVQRTCSEAAAEVQKAFPTTIKCTGGMLRFNAEHDILSLSVHKNGLEELFYDRLQCYNQGAVAFEGDWHTIPQKLMMVSCELWYAFRDVYNSVYRILRNPSSFVNPLVPQWLQGFVSFLGDCTNLRVFGFTYSTVLWSKLRRGESPVLQQSVAGSRPSPHWHEVLRKYLASRYPGPAKQGPFYSSKPESGSNSFEEFVSGIEGLEMLIRGVPFKTIPQAVLHEIRFGHEKLQHLRLLLMIPIEPEAYVLMLGQGQE
ncbi:hypothetical protein Daus18300_006562 [Diaporthe australafricana]|uniref:2EXR domain-containing protein n=1 Tax=Diaporthe australafricana TaxID=127596 RepID=A0ABR3WT50_9PEZI